LSLRNKRRAIIFGQGRIVISLDFLFESAVPSLSNKVCNSPLSSRKKERRQFVGKNQLELQDGRDKRVSKLEYLSKRAKKFKDRITNS